jgi:hypothetical protein
MKSKRGREGIFDKHKINTGFFNKKEEGKRRYF